MNRHGLGYEVRLLEKALPRLATPSVVDVGAESGAFTRAMMRAGAVEVHAVEPAPRNIEFLRKRFCDEPRVTIHALAIDRADGHFDVHFEADPACNPSLLSTLLEDDADEITRHETLRASSRSLGSLVAAAEMPARVGILRLDTGGNELRVIDGLGDLDCDVVAAACPSTPESRLASTFSNTTEMVAALSSRGLHHFAFFVYHGAYTTMLWDDAGRSVPDGGTLVFLHDRVLAALLPEVVECASALTSRIAELAEHRLEAIARIERQRERYVETVERSLATIQAIDRERIVQSEAARERLQVIERLTAATEPG